PTLRCDRKWEGQPDPEGGKIAAMGDLVEDTAVRGADRAFVSHLSQEWETSALSGRPGPEVLGQAKRSEVEHHCSVLPALQPMLASTGAIAAPACDWAFEPKLDGGACSSTSTAS